MKVLVACEFSGVVRDAFLARGHDAYSCDLLPSLKPSERHYQYDARELLKEPWDLVIAHPPCTYLTNMTACFFRKGVPVEQCSRYLNAVDGAKFFQNCLEANATKVCVENPIILTWIKKTYTGEPSQIIHPWQFGHPYSKTTCLWLKGLPQLIPTKIVVPQESLVAVGGRGRKMRRNGVQEIIASAKNSQSLRALTYPGIAKAMAEQWGQG